jgi:hypothetical protein
MDDSTTMWLQDPTRISPSVTPEAQLFTWFFFANVTFLMIKAALLILGGINESSEVGFSEKMPVAPKKQKQ